MAADPQTSQRETGGTAGADPLADDHYAVLGVPVTASPAEIRRAYRAAMKAVHPDRQRPHLRAAAEERARRLNAAYTVLSRPLERQAYDRTIRARVVQDEIMHRYVGGFHVPGGNGADPLARHLRREPSAAERRERDRADRSALVSLVLVFGGATAALLGLLLLWSLLAAAAAGLGF